ILLIALILLSPILLFIAIKHFCLSWSIRRALRHTWPPNKWILLSYTQSKVWAPYLESELIPKLGDACLAIDRSRADWKDKFPLEARAIEFWGGGRSYNPLVILFPKNGGVEIVRLYDEFQDMKHGKDKPLESKVVYLFSLVEKYSDIR